MRLVPLCHYGPDTFAAPRPRNEGLSGPEECISEGKAAAPYRPEAEYIKQPCTSKTESFILGADSSGHDDGGPQPVSAVRSKEFLYVIHCVRLSYCGQLVVCGCSDGFVRIYSSPVVPAVIDDETVHAEAVAATGPLSLPLCRALLCQKGNTSPVTCVAWRPAVPPRSIKTGHSRRARGAEGFSHVFIATTGAGEIFQCALTCTQASASSPANGPSASQGAGAPSAYSVHIIWKEAIPNEQLLCCCYAPTADLFAAAGSARTIYVINDLTKNLLRKLDKPPALPCVKPVETAAASRKGGNLVAAIDGKGGKARWAATMQQKNEEEGGNWFRLKQRPAAQYYAAAAAASRGAHANRITQLIFLKKFKLALEDVTYSSNSKGEKNAGKHGGASHASPRREDAFKGWNNKTLLLSAGADESVKLWDVDEGSCFSSLADVAPLGTGVSVVSPTTVAVASCRNQQQMQLFALPSFAAASTVEFNCTCTCPGSVQPGFGASPVAAAKAAPLQVTGAAAAASGTSCSNKPKSEGVAVAGSRCCGNGCKYYEEPASGKTTSTAGSKCEEADLNCYIHACKALSIEGADLLICGGSNRNQLRCPWPPGEIIYINEDKRFLCYVRTATTPTPMPTGSSSAVCATAPSLSPSPRPAMKGGSNVCFSLFGLASFAAPPNTLDCLSLIPIVDDKFAGEDAPAVRGSALHQHPLGPAIPGGAYYSVEAGAFFAKLRARRGQGNATDALGSTKAHTGEVLQSAGLPCSRAEPELDHEDSDGNSHSGYGLSGDLKKISFSAVFAKPHAAITAEKKTNALLKDAKKQQKLEQEKRSAAARALKTGCRALIVTACHDHIYFFCVTPSPASLPPGFVDAVREHAQQQLEDRAQGALFRVLINHPDENEKKTPAPYASGSSARPEGFVGEATFDEVSSAAALA